MNRTRSGRRRGWAISAGRLPPAVGPSVELRQRGEARASRITDTSAMTWLDREERRLLDGKSAYLATLSDAELEALLERLEGEEHAASRRRNSLHRRIEFVHSGGAASAEQASVQLASWRAAERQLSDRRLLLHHQIDELRAERSRRSALRAC